jgi:hypothetical protein
MKINITPNTDQIRFYAKSALNVWDVLPPDLARENVISSMTALLRYLDACDNGNGVVVVGIGKVERGVRLEVSRRYEKVFDLTDRYFGEAQIAHETGDLQRPVAGDVEDMRLHSVAHAESVKVDLQPSGEGGLQR